MISQVHLWIFVSVEFGFKHDSYLWGIQMMGKKPVIVPFSMKVNFIQKSKWEFRMLFE